MSYISLSTKEVEILRELRKLYILEEYSNSEEKMVRIKTCDWDKFKNFILDVYKSGIKEGRARELKDIKTLINKTVSN